jgi:hypothetical protein
MRDDRGKSVPVEGLSEFFVRVHGTLSGPGTYGHKGMAMYELTADSLIEISTPTASDCSRTRRPSAHQ